MLIGPLYHWSPADRFDSILTGGLRPSSPHVISTQPYPFVCASPDPQTAWHLSGAQPGADGYPTWDLWQITLADNDQVQVRPERGARVWEVQIGGVIPPQRLFHVGRRDTQPATAA